MVLLAIDLIFISLVTQDVTYVALDFYASQMTGMELSTQVVVSREITLEDVTFAEVVIEWMAAELG